MKYKDVRIRYGTQTVIISEIGGRVTDDLCDKIIIEYGLELGYFDNCVHFKSIKDKKAASRFIVDAVPHAINDPCRIDWMTLDYWKRITSRTMPKDLQDWSCADYDNVRAMIIFVKCLDSSNKLLNWNVDTFIGPIVVGFFECILFGDLHTPRDKRELKKYYYKVSNSWDVLQETKSSTPKRLIKKLVKQVYRYLQKNAVAVGLQESYDELFNVNALHFMCTIVGESDVADNFAECCLHLLDILQDETESE